MRLLIIKNKRRADDQIIRNETGNNEKYSNFIFLISSLPSYQTKELI